MLLYRSTGEDCTTDFRKCARGSDREELNGEHIPSHTRDGAVHFCGLRKRKARFWGREWTMGNETQSKAQVDVRGVWIAGDHVTLFPPFTQRAY